MKLSTTALAITLTASTFILLCSASPLPLPLPVTMPSPSPTTSNAISYIQLISSKNPHYSTGSVQTLSASNSPSTTIPLLVGMPLDLSTDMPYAQAVQIARIAQGGSLSGQEVLEDDKRVVCKVMLDVDAERVVEVRVQEDGTPGVLVDGGKVARVKGVVCEIDE